MASHSLETIDDVGVHTGGGDGDDVAVEGHP